jgi:hypothetical protein
MRRRYAAESSACWHNQRRASPTIGARDALHENCPDDEGRWLPFRGCPPAHHIARSFRARIGGLLRSAYDRFQEPVVRVRLALRM